MILGIGTDLCDIRRIERSIDKFGDRFLSRIFTLAERDYCESKSGKASYYAKRFAGKEAAAKALGREDTGALSWQDVEIVNAPSGLPQITLRGGAKVRLQEATPAGHGTRIHLSLTDDFPYAQAFVIVEAFPEVDS